MRNSVTLLSATVLLSAAQLAWSQDHGADFSGVWTNDPEQDTRSFQNHQLIAGLPPMTEWAMERFEQSKPTFGDRSVPVADTNDPVYDCFPPGTPRIYMHPFPMEIVHTPGRMVMLFEYDHILRQVYTDGREHRTDLAPMYMGDSTGHWEGETLVIETVNFNDTTWVDRRGVPHSEEMRVEERISLVNPDRLRIDIRIEDPVAFTEPWTAQRHYRRVDWDIEEFICMDSVNFEEYEQSVLDYEGESN